MSEPERDELFERNLERLLNRAGPRPRVPEASRARMLARLQATSEERRGAEAPSTRAHRGPAHSAPARSAPTATKGGSSTPPTASRTSARRIRARQLGIAALAAAVLALLVFGLRLGPRGSGSDGEVARYVHEEFGVRELTLADGTRALLRRGTELAQLGPRHVALISGEVLLEIRDTALPLLIDTPQGRAQARGSQLLLRSEGETTLAAVLRGSVRLSSETGELALRGGEQATLAADAAPERIAGRRLSWEVDWAKALLASDQPKREPIRRGNLIARVPRWTGQTERSREWPLPVRQLTVDVHVEDGHVRTTIDQTFFNHLSSTLEGVYRFPLPPSAAVARLAMYVDEQRMEAGVVRRDRGRNIYEQIVHRRRDPALLEWMQGNLFQIRLFPLPGRQEKRVLLSYTQALDELYGTGSLRVPIPELDLPVGEVRYRIRVVGGRRADFAARNHGFELREEGGDLIAEFSASDHTIGDDIVVDLAGAASGASEGLAYHSLRHEDGRRHLSVRLRPELEALAAQQSAAPARDWVVLVDTSASREPGELEAQRGFVLALSELLDDGDRIAVQAFDSRSRWFSAGPGLTTVAELDRPQLAEFLAREAGSGRGTTELAPAVEAALERLASAEAPEGDGREREATVLYLGDGLTTSLATSASAETVRSLLESRRDQLQFAAVSFGPRHDEPTLARLAAAGDGLHLHVDEGDEPSWRALELLATLATPRVLDLEAELLDAAGRAIAPARTHAGARSLVDGEALELLAELGPDDPEPVAVVLRGRQAGAGSPDSPPWQARVELPAAPQAGAGWLPRAWARAHIDALIEAGTEANYAEIEALGLAHFLVTPATSLLVLEREQMYADFDVRRPSETSWARYPAPETIEVVREGDGSEAAPGQYVVRTPVPVLVSYATTNTLGSFGRRGETGRGLWGTSVGESSGFGGRGLSGYGRGGGGGFGQGTIGLGNTGWIGAGPSRSSARKEQSVSFVTHTSEANKLERWRSRSGPGVPSLDIPDAAVFQQDRITASLTTGTHSAAGGLLGNLHSYPQAMHYSADPRLDDLSELVPALFEDSYDVARARLLITGLGAARGAVSDDAAELIAAARQAVAETRYRGPDGALLDIDSEGHFSVAATRWGILHERVRYDGERMRSDYLPLGLSVVREVGPTSPALLDRWVPWLVPPAEHLAHFYRVELGEGRGEGRSLVLTSLAGDQAEADAARLRLEVEFDDQHRIVALRSWVGASLLSDQRMSWSEDELLISDASGERRFARVARSAELPASEAQGTRVELPLASPADFEAKLGAHPAGSATWRQLQHQRLAGYAALGQRERLFAILDELREHGQLQRGELVLASGGLSFADDKLRERVLASAAEREGEAELVIDYLRAAAKLHKRTNSAMAKLAARRELADTPVGLLASYRLLLVRGTSGPIRSRVDAFAEFASRYAHPTLSYAAATLISNRLGWSQARERARLWQALAEHSSGEWRLIALHQAGASLYSYGQSAEAFEPFAQSFAEAEAQATVPYVDWTVVNSWRTTRGDAAWELSWAQLRARVAKSKRLDTTLAFLAAAQRINRADDGLALLEAFPADALTRTGTLTLVNVGRVAEAGQLIAALRKQGDDEVEVLLWSAMIAERQGRLDDAARELDGALARRLAGPGLELGELRLRYAQLFEIHARRSRSLSADTSARERATTQALDIAERWRREDPDNPEIDQLSAELLWAQGRDDEALRELVSSIDRRPGDGETLAWVAAALERAGRINEATSVWSRAIAVEPTNPIHRLRQAENCLARGERQQAERVLTEIIEGDWQPRFAFVVDDARKLTGSLSP